MNVFTRKTNALVRIFSHLQNDSIFIGFKLFLSLAKLFQSIIYVYLNSDINLEDKSTSF